MSVALQLVTERLDITGMERLVTLAQALGVPETLEPRDDDGRQWVLDIPEETVQQITSKLLAARQGR
jgi:hypothetical protein